MNPPTPAELAGILDAMPDAVVRTDASARVVYANRRFREWFCPAACDPAAVPLGELVTPAHGIDLPGWHAQAASGVEPLPRVALPILDGLGRRTWYEAVVQAVRPAGAFEGMLVVLRDITALKQAEADQAEMQARLFITQKYEALGTLAGGIAHDFNNVLSGIINFATLAREDTPAGQTRVRGYLDEVLRAGQRARELVRQIQLFRRSESEERVPFSLPQLMREALSLLRSTLPAALEIKSDLDRDVPLVLANPLRIHQAVVNLAINAVQAMRARGGTLRVRLKAASIDAALAESLPPLRPGEHVVLTVEDDGCGMEPAVLARACEPYFTTRKVGEGSGMGLSVVQSTVRAHDGALRIRSVPGRGTIVEIFLPSHVPEPVPSDPVADFAALPRGRGQHLLLVDDEAPIARSGQMLLERLGYRVSMFTHPEAALAAFWAAPDQFDALITDHQMPGMNGLELGRRLRAARPDLPVFIASGFADTRPDLLRAEGVAALLPKPFEIAELARVLQLPDRA